MERWGWAARDGSERERGARRRKQTTGKIEGEVELNIVGSNSYSAFLPSSHASSLQIFPLPSHSALSSLLLSLSSSRRKPFLPSLLSFLSQITHLSLHPPPPLLPPAVSSPRPPSLPSPTSERRSSWSPVDYRSTSPYKLAVAGPVVLDEKSGRRSTRARGDAGWIGEGGSLSEDRASKLRFCSQSCMVFEALRRRIEWWQFGCNLTKKEPAD